MEFAITHWLYTGHACFCVLRSTDYGATFQNESHKWPRDAKANWYYISQDDDDNVGTTLGTNNMCTYFWLHSATIQFHKLIQ